MGRKIVGSILLGVVLFWFVLVLSLYFINHKPFGLDQATRIGLSLWRIVAGFLLLSVCGALGGALFRGNGYPGPVRLALQAALGMGVMGIGLLILGSAGGFSAGILGVGTLLLGIALLRPMLRWWRLWGEALHIDWEGDRFQKAVAVLCGLILLVTLGSALSPPIKFDALVYHLTLPETYLQAGSIPYTPWLMFWGMPQTIEMLYAPALIFGGAEAATVFGWLIGLTALTGIFGFLVPILGGRGAWAAIACVLAGSTTAAALAWGYVEWGSVLLGLCLVASLYTWTESFEWRDLILAGVFAGFAIGVKYTGGVLFLAGLSVISWKIFARKEAGWKSLVIFLGTAFIACSPWLVKNWIATGNPIYPFIFPAGAMDPTRLELFQGLPVWGDLQTVLTLPFEAILGGVENSPGFGASIGPLFLLLGALAWIGWRSRRPQEQRLIGLASLVLLVGFVAWGIASRFSGYLIQTRLYFPLIPAAASLSGAGFNSLDSLSYSSVRPGRIAGILLLLVLGLNLYELATVSVRQGVPAFLTGLKSEGDFLSENLGWLYPASLAMQEIPGESPVLMLWEPRSYYCNPKCRPDEVIDRWLSDYRRYTEPEQIRASWVQDGFSFLLLNRSGMDFVRQGDSRYTSADWADLDHLLDELVLVEDFGGIYELYRLTP